MNKILLFSFLFALAVTGNSQTKYDEAVDALVVWQKNGEKIFFSLEKRPTITTTSENFMLETGDVHILFPLDSFVRCSFGSLPTSVKSALQRQPIFNITKNQLNAHGLKPRSSFALINVGGMNFADGVVGDDGSIVLSIIEIPTGIYVFQNEDITFKFNKL